MAGAVPSIKSVTKSFLKNASRLLAIKAGRLLSCSGFDVLILTTGLKNAVTRQGTLAESGWKFDHFRSPRLRPQMAMAVGSCRDDQIKVVTENREPTDKPIHLHPPFLLECTAGTSDRNQPLSILPEVLLDHYSHYTLLQKFVNILALIS